MLLQPLALRPVVKQSWEGRDSAAGENRGITLARRLNRIYPDLLLKELLSLVYVLSVDGKPLMPTERHGKVRRLLKSGRAEVIMRTPSTAGNLSCWSRRNPC